MSIQVSEQVWQRSQSRNGARLVLLALAEHADDNGVCFPGRKRLMERAKVSDRALDRALHWLSAHRELVIEVGTGPKGCNYYQIKLPPVKTTPGAEMTPPVKTTPGAEMTPPVKTTLGVASERRPGVASKRRPKPSGNRQGTVSTLPLPSAAPQEPGGGSSGGDGGGRILPTTAAQASALELGQELSARTSSHPLPSEELWRWVCRIVERRPDDPRTAEEQAALRGSDQITEADVTLLFRFMADERKRRTPLSILPAQSLLEGLIRYLGIAESWAERYPNKAFPRPR